ncbi:MAG: hypothetical protein V4538_15390 [Bacteroidota bacterium]
MKLLRTFKDAASVEIAWYNALIQAQKDGFTLVVNAVSKTAGLQKHYFKDMDKANEFYLMAKDNKEYWNGATKPQTIKASLTQCWS